MRKIRDFMCDEHHITEHYVDDDCRELLCPVCGKISMRIISPVRSIFKGHGWADKDLKWAKEHERAAKPKQH